jgi:hypothetical protein
MFRKVKSQVVIKHKKNCKAIVKEKEGVRKR